MLNSHPIHPYESPLKYANLAKIAKIRITTHKALNFLLARHFLPTNPLKYIKTLINQTSYKHQKMGKCVNIACPYPQTLYAIDF